MNQQNSLIFWFSFFTFLEHLDKNENFCVFEVDGAPARNSRDDGVNNRLARQRVVIVHFEFYLVLLPCEIKSEDMFVSAAAFGR
jgi:hypothetical protein